MLLMGQRPGAGSGVQPRYRPGMPGFLDKVSKGLGGLADSVNKAVQSQGSGSTGAPPAPGASGPVAAPPPPGMAATAPPPPPPGTVTEAPPLPSVGTQPPLAVEELDGFVDSTQPDTWITTERMATVVGYHTGAGVVFEEPQTFARDDAVVARFASVDGRYTVDLVSLHESTLGELGTQEAALEHLLAGVSEHVDEDIPERALTGTTGPGHACCVDVAGDMALRVDLYGPAELAVGTGRAVVARLARDVLLIP